MSDAITEARRVQRAMDEVTEGQDEPMALETHPERTRQFSSLGFARMRTRWSTSEQAVIQRAEMQADNELMRDYADIYRIMNRLYEIVREPLVDGNGEVVTDRFGFAVWRKDEFDMVAEDWSRLTERDKEGFIHQISTRLVLWEQKAANHWAEAMYAKASWEERFAISFMETEPIEGKRPTEADRTQNAQAHAREERYLAIYMSVRSRKAEALVRSMDRLCQRLKDTSR